jgi:hypothetical protein
MKNKNILYVLLSILFPLLISGPAFSLDSKDIVRLKKAGISDGIGFKSREAPNIVVRRISGMDCFMFKKKLRNRKEIAKSAMP